MEVMSSSPDFLYISPLVIELVKIRRIANDEMNDFSNNIMRNHGIEEQEKLISYAIGHLQLATNVQQYIYYILHTLL